MLKINWLLLHILPIFGFFLAMTLLVHQNRAQRSPASTVAWLLAILLVPYIGVPAYMIFGGRKIRQMTKNKANLDVDVRDTASRHTTQGVGSIFPLREHNEIILFSTGEKAYVALMNLIYTATKSIDISIYLLGNDETGSAILEALSRKAKQGVRVRLLMDALGSFRVSRKILAPFLAAGGVCAFFMPMLHLPFRGRANLRNHRKLIIIDNATAMLGGMNIAREYMGSAADSNRWCDISFIVKGTAITDLHHVFRSDWQFASKQETVFEKCPVRDRSETGVTVELVPSGPDVTGDPLYESIITVLFKAQHRVWIITPYFIPDEMMLKAICIAARRGVDVRIVVPLVSNHRLADLVRRSYLRQIQDSGAVVYNYTPGMMHGKVILVDTALGIVGSMNMDIRSFFLNYEISLFIYDTTVASELEQWVNDLMRQSYTGIKKSNIMLGFIEGLGRLLSPLL